MPLWVRTRAPLSPIPATDSTSSEPASASASARGSSAVAMMSRSLTDSAQRRAEPASSTWCEVGWSRSSASSGSAIAQRAVEHEAARRAAAGLGGRGRARDRLEEVLLRSGAEPSQVADPLLSGGALQRLQRVDPELLVEAAGALGPQARQARHLQQAGRELRPQSGGLRDVTGLDERDQLRLQRRADAGQLGDAALARERGDRDGGVARDLGGVAVGDDAVDDRAVQLVEVAQLVEGGGDLAVGGVGHGENLASGPLGVRSWAEKLPSRAHYTL